VIYVSLDRADEEIFNALVEKIEVLTPTHFVFELKSEEQDEGGGNLGFDSQKLSPMNNDVRGFSHFETVVFSRVLMSRWGNVCENGCRS